MHYNESQKGRKYLYIANNLSFFQIYPEITEIFQPNFISLWTKAVLRGKLVKKEAVLC